MIIDIVSLLEDDNLAIYIFILIQIVYFYALFAGDIKHKYR